MTRAPEYPAGILTPPAWQTHAACAGLLDAMFPDDGRENWLAYRYAKRICDRCPVRVECLNAALSNGEQHGLWGGKTPRQRRRMRRDAA